MCYLSFSPCAFNLLSLFLIFVSLITRCIGGYSHQYTSLGLSSLDKPPWVYPAWDSLPFLDLVDHFVSHVREVFSYYCLRYFLESFLSVSSPYGTPLVHLKLSQKFLTLSSLFGICFLYSVSQQWFPPFCPPGPLSILLPQLFCYWLLVFCSSQFVL